MTNQRLSHQLTARRLWRQSIKEALLSLWYNMTFRRELAAYYLFLSNTSAALGDLYWTASTSTSTSISKENL